MDKEEIKVIERMLVRNAANRDQLVASMSESPGLVSKTMQLTKDFKSAAIEAMSKYNEDDGHAIRLSIIFCALAVYSSILEETNLRKKMFKLQDEDESPG